MKKKSSKLTLYREEPVAEKVLKKVVCEVRFGARLMKIKVFSCVCRVKALSEVYPN